MRIFFNKPKPPRRELVSAAQRDEVLTQLLGKPINLELVVQGFLLTLAEDYQPGELQLVLLSNHTMYAAPKTGQQYRVIAPNGWRGSLTACGLGIVASLLSFSYLSFGKNIQLSTRFDDQYTRLIESLVDLPERSSILETTR
jgi:hypothetical protein